MRLIGQMEAWTLTSENVLPAGRKTRALLAVVALSSPRPALRGRLAELLWSRRPEEQARASLRQEIHRLLETLAPAGAEILQARDPFAAPRVWVMSKRSMRATTDQPARCRCWMATCWRIWTGSTRRSMRGSAPNARGCATGPARLPRPAARAGRAGDRDPGSAAAAADRPCARRRLAGTDARPCRAASVAWRFGPMTDVAPFWRIC
jgi:hypothetical protein